MPSEPRGALYWTQPKPFAWYADLPAQSVNNIWLTYGKGGGNARAYYCNAVAGEIEHAK